MKAAALGPLLLLALLATTGCETRGPEPDISLERMIDQPKADVWEPSPVFADGMAMRQPPEGTQAREWPLAPEAVVTGRHAGRWVERVPVRLTRSDLERGRTLFEIDCAACHGRTGDAETPVARAMRLRPPPSLLEPRIRALPAGRLFEVAGHGYGLMPAYEEVLPVGDRWRVVAYLQVLQWSRAVPLAELPPQERRRARAALDRLRRRRAVEDEGERSEP